MQMTLQGTGAQVIIGPDQPTVIIGERINPTGRKAFSAELQAGDLSRIEKDALAQVEAGAAVLDVNVGTAGVDEVALLPRAVQIVQEAVSVPICIDSANPEALSAALKVVKGRALVNSVNGEEAHLEAILPIVAEHGAAVIGLCMDDDGIPTDPEGRVAVAEKILERAARVGLKAEDVLIDPLVLTIGADHTAILTTITAARLIRESFGCNMTCGASNGSHGMPDRELLNTVFLTGFIQAGINAPICNPHKNALAIRAVDLMLGKDMMGMNYIMTYRKFQSQGA
ncbi:MAG: dihydropteroate synthase [Anaerolineae bacterium]|nr:dihydropteroate synthase [Anaerolineae bacterium]